EITTEPADRQTYLQSFNISTALLLNIDLIV
ncbi:unnamed protein product, partial [marine sediment metagenome]